jgi:hypothetical protein
MPITSQSISNRFQYYYYYYYYYYYIFLIFNLITLIIYSNKLDVSDAADHDLGLSTFTIMAGIGGAIGYFIGNFFESFLLNLYLC